VASEPSETVRLLGAFDAYVLGAGTTAAELSRQASLRALV
jgi:hypothetical protein